MEGKLAAGQEREGELQTRVTELGECKEQLEEELVTLSQETSTRVCGCFVSSSSNSISISVFSTP